MIKNYSLYGLLALIFILVSITLTAQPPLSGTTGPPCFPPPCIPIDGGSSLLIAAVLIWGGKKAFDHRKKG